MSQGQMNRVDEIFAKSQGATEFARNYADYLGTLLKKLDFAAVDRFIQIMLNAREEGRTVYFIGNGGSAATASHFANDFAIGTRCPWKPFRVMSLTDNNAVMTAIANDFGFEELFTKQLETCLRAGDVVVAISASGNSPNLLKAVEYARKTGATTVGLVGFDGGKLKDMTDISIHVETPKGEYGPVEDVHMFIDHLMGSYLNRVVMAEKR